MVSLQSYRNNDFDVILICILSFDVITHLGIRHDDYDYGEINQLLDRSLKTFIKAACCYPDRITKKDYDSILVELLDSEKVHVNLMLMEAKNQAILLYSLREIMQYML
jgi:sestrin 1/3